MSVRILYIKNAYIEEESLRLATRSDMDGLSSVVEKVFAGQSVRNDVCAVSEDREWIMDGRVIDPIITASYDWCIVFVHSGTVVFDVVKDIVSAYGKKVIYMYDLVDMMFHHAERLEQLIRTNIDNVQVKFPHQKHVDIQEYNDKYVPVEDIVKKYFRQLFLPAEVLSTQHAHHIGQGVDVVHTPTEFAESIHARRHMAQSLTFREHINGKCVYVATLPKYRNEKVYASIPFVQKNIQGLSVWDTSTLTHTEREHVLSVAKQVSHLAFTNQPVVYTLTVHQKRGVFIQSTVPLVLFTLQHPDFFFMFAHENGIPPVELFERLRYNQ